MKTKRVFLLTILILIIGLISVYSASHIWANYKFGDSLYYIKRQFLFACLGILGMYIAFKIDYHIYKKYSSIILVISFILMILVLIPGVGVVRGGSRSWFNLGIFALQPSEIFKIAIIIYSAKYIEINYYKLKKVKYSFKLLVILCLGFMLIMLQPDFGSGVVIVCGVIVMLIATPFPFKYFIGLGIFGLIGIIIMIISAPYRIERILSFIDPFQDPLGSGFQAIQSLYSVGPGGLLGVGFNHSIQKHFYLPEPQTDFIFSIFAEEFGFVGIVLLIYLYYALFKTCIQIAKESNDLFSCFLTIGIVSMIAIQSLINLGVVVGLFPVTGVTLPLMSYGGTSLTITLISIGIILNVSRD